MITATATTVTVTGRKAVTYSAANLETLEIDGLAGDDRLDVDNSTGLVALSAFTKFDGGVGNDLLRLIGSTTVTSSVYNVGPGVGDGSSIHTLGATVQKVFFTNLEPVIDIVASATLTVNATNSANSINLVEGPNSGGALAGSAESDQVSIDGFEPIEFANKTTLIINGLAGNDTVNLNDGDATAAAGLTGITVNGGDATTGDLIIVNDSTPGTAIVFSPTATDAASVAAAQPVTVTITTTEHVTINGLGGNDTLRVVTPTGLNTITLTPGATVDAGDLRVDSLVALDFLNLGATGTVDLTDSDAARIDTFIYNGTGASDVFSVLATSGSVRLNSQVLVTTPGISRLVLNALEGDDATTINYPQPYNGSPNMITVNGGGPGGSDSLTIIGAVAAVDAFTVTPSTQPHNGAVLVNAVNNLYTGIEHLFLTGNAGDSDTLLVNDDGRDNTWNVSAGTVGDLVQVDGRESIDYNNFRDVTLTNGLGTDLFRVWPTNLTGYTNSLTINGDATGVDDVLEVYGTPAADTVTTTANVITTNSRPVTAGVNLVELKIVTLGGNDTVTVALSVAGARNVIDLGAGNDTLTATTSSGVAVYAGEGDDSITASNVVDTIYGDAGNDTILALDGNDLVYAGTGNDSITGGVGNDNLFGGDGSDRFVWNNGDNSDIVEGDDGVDVQIVNGAAAGDIFNLRTATNNQARSFFERTNLVPFTIDMGQIEQVDINSLAGADQVAVRDLSTTEIRQVNVDVGTAANLDTVTVDGRTVSDSVTLTALTGGVVNIAGLKYDVNVSSLNSTADLDTLTFNANEGDDTVVASDGLNAIFGTTLVNVNHLTINGGEGDDVLTGFGQLNGGAGNDTLNGGNFAQSISGGDGNDRIFGGSGDDVLNGDAGEDSFIGGLGNDTIDGGADWDAILVNGTSGADVIDVNQTTSTTLVQRVNATTETDTLVLLAGVRTVEEARVDAGSGADTIRVRVTDSVGTNLIDAVVNSLQMTVHGGDATGAGDRLIIVDDGPADHSRDDLTIYRKDQDDSSGRVTVGPGNPEAFENVFDGIERVQFVDGSGAAVSAEPGSTSRLVVFKHDPFEYNDDRFVATHIGANSVVNVDPSIDPGSVADPFGDGFAVATDVDWYRIEAVATGTLDIQAFFEEIATIPSSGRPGLPNNGDLQIEIYDADGFVNGVPLAIAGNGPNFGINNGAGDTNNDGDPFAENERIRIPAVQGQIYYLRVFGATAAGVTAINNYNLTLINEAPPTPFDLELADNLTFLTGSQEAPVSVVTNASGTANFQYNAIANTFDLDLFVTGVELTNLTGLPELTAAHIHSGAVGVAGPVLVTLPGAASWSVEPAGIRLRLTGAAFSGAAGDIAALLAGNTYFNIHTTANAGGEIRGQIQIPNVLGVTDSGRSQLDNTTNDNTPTIFLRVDDAGLLNDVPGNAVGVVGAPPVDEVIAIPHNSSTSASPVGLAPGYRVAIYDEGDTHAPVLLGFAQPVANLRGVYSFTFPNALTDGSHFLSAKLQMIDPADNDTAAGTQTRATGFGPRSQSLEIIVDTVAPPVFFGAAAIANDGLIPDQGVIPQPAFFVDNKTNDQTPTFWGTAEANTVIRVFADLTPANGVDNFDLLVGLTVTLPTDGTNQFPNGQWRVTSTVDFNNPAFFPVDGLRRLLVTAEDLAGNLKSGGAAQALDVFLDTQGAQVTNVQITSALTYDLFDPKPSLGPTPRTDGLTISFRDFPIRTAGFPNPAVNPIVAVNPGHYVLRGDANGIIPISSITFVGDPSVPGSAATGRVLLTFPAPLLDDRYTLTVNDGVVDDVGNKLDGESNAIQPLETPGFPSGDGQPGGDFVARFTIDSRSEIGAVGQGGITIDINGNMHFDPTNTDFVNRDLVFEVGLNTDRYIAGKFNPAAAVIQDGFDRIAAYGLLNRQYRWLIDFNNDGRPDYSAISGLQINATPISGDFNPAHVGDEIGLFDGKKWYFDTNGNNNIDAGDRSFTGNLAGVPITGDFDGDGKVDLAVHNAQLNLFSFDLTSKNDGTFGVLDGNADYTISFDNSAVPGSQTNLFPGVLERPFAGDFNLDGITDIGLMVPNRDGASPSTSTAEFYIFQSIAAAAVPGTAAALNHQFSPKPLGVDLYAQFGSNVSVPLVGNFDPPVTPTTSTDPIPTPLEITLPSIGGTFTVLREGDNLHVRNAKGDDLIAARPMDGISNVRIVGGKAADVVVLDSSLSGFAEIFQFEGGNGADRLDASLVNFAVTFDGGAGNDTFLGGGGNDVFLGGTGDDIASGGSGNDLLDGGDGNDALTGNAGADNLLGGAGNDRLDAGNGNDVLNGQAGNDVLLGGADDDLLTGDAGNDAFDGGAGTDRIVESGNVNLTISSTGLTGLGTDTFLINTLETASLTGGAGNNTLTVNGFQGSVTLVGGAGNDVLTGGVGDDSLDGGDGTDLLIVTGAMNAVLTNVLLTGTGNDVLSQIELVKLTVSVSALTSNIDASDFTGNVTLIGGNGADTLKGGRGNDSILGGAGNDDLRGGAGLDTIDGGAGNDNLRGDDGNDKLLGSTGNDTILGGADNDSIDGGADDDVLLGEDGNDTILGGTGDRASDTLGSRGDDIIIGGAGNDVLSGQDGNDTIFGGTGDDKLSGGNGSDTLSGEDGIDTLAGDAGSDALFGGADLDVFTKPAVGEVNENGVFNDAVFFTRLDALLSAIP